MPDNYEVKDPINRLLERVKVIDVLKIQQEGCRELMAKMICQM
jgi:hypothetical protein